MSKLKGRGKQKSTIEYVKIANVLKVFILINLLVIAFYPPYLQGLYFERQQLSTEIYTFALFIIFLIYKWIKRDYTFLKTKIQCAAFGFVAVYFISIFIAVNTRAAISEWLKYCMYFAIFYMITELFKENTEKKALLWVMAASAFGVSILGLDASAGGNFVALLNNLFMKLGRGSNMFFGLTEWNRIYSTLQYANALASYLLAVFIIVAGLLMVSEKIWERVLAGIAGFIIFTTFMLTQSRGAQLLFPVALVILLFTVSKGHKIKCLITTILLSLPAIAISFKLYSYISSEETHTKEIWTLLLIGSIITSGLAAAIKYINNRKINWKICISIIAIVILLAAGLLYILVQSGNMDLTGLSGLTARFKNLASDEQLMARIIFYKDGLKIFQDRWFLGAGGGAWQYLYQQYQSYNYPSNQAHNYPLQLGIETGILGLIALASLVVLLIWSYYKYYKNNSEEETKNNCQLSIVNCQLGVLTPFVFTAISSLLLHSIMDFDFSESAIFLLFWQLLALYNGELKGKQLSTINYQLSTKKRVGKKQEISKLPLTAALLITIIILFLPIRYTAAYAYADKTFDNLRDDKIEDAILNMDKAVSLDKFNEKYKTGYRPVPTRPDIVIGYVDLVMTKSKVMQSNGITVDNLSNEEKALLQQQYNKADEYINQEIPISKNNPALSGDIANYCFQTGKTEDGINYLNQSIRLRPLIPEVWDNKVNIYYQLMILYLNQDDYNNALSMVDKGLETINEVTEVNKKNMYPFILSENAINKLQKMQLIKDKWGSNEQINLNKVIHYSIMDLDTNLDNIPDQWVEGNKDSISLLVSEQGLKAETNKESYIRTEYPIALEKGKKYFITVSPSEPVEGLAYSIDGVTDKTALEYIDNKYYSEFSVESDPGKNNTVRLYLNSDCTIKEVLIEEI